MRAIAIVLDLVQPAGASGRHAGSGRDARLDEAFRPQPIARAVPPGQVPHCGVKRFTPYLLIGVAY